MTRIRTRPIIKLTGLVLTGLTLTGLVISGCGSGTGESSETASAESADVQSASDTAPTTHVIRVESIELVAQTFEDVVELTGAVEAIDDASLSARSAGTIVSLLPLGARVGAGYAVAQVDPGLLRAAVDQAKAQLEVTRAQLELAEDAYARQEPLYRDSIVSPLEYQQVRAQLAQARAQHAQTEALVNQAEEQLAQTMITSPFAGTVEEHFIEKGEQVAPGTPVARVVNTSRVRVVAGVPERYAGDIRQDTRVRLEFGSYDLSERMARVSFVGSAIDSGSRTIPIEVVVDNRDGRLKPEMIADVFVTRDVIEDAIVAPQAAVLRDEDGNSVYVVDRSGDRPRARRRVVTVGNTNNGRVHITSGLESGDELITLGANSVAPGDVVQVVGGESTRSS